MSHPINGSTVINGKNGLMLLQGLACGVGYVFTFIGWVLFTLGVVCLADAGPSPWIEEPFRWASYWIVPGWLLLRLGNGLFPFSRKLFKGKS
jgi:hypothetical protein